MEKQNEMDNEIAIYSMMENVAYMAFAAEKLMRNSKIPDVPLPVLVTAIIQLAEAFDREHGSEKVGEDTVSAISQYAEKNLVKQFGQ